jgi:putative flippase GtrA
MTAEPEKSAPAARHALSGPASRALAATGAAVLRCMPGPVRRKLETEAGQRFGRFVPVAIAALASSQITLAFLIWVNMTAGKAALCASIVGALVSYLLSRWAWERKGRPDLLRETVPFWLVSLAVWGVLSLTTHYAGAYAKQEHLHHLSKLVVVNGAYLAANCVTFVTRFLIFHYLLFANKKQDTSMVTAELAEAVGVDPGVAGPAVPADDAPRMALTAESAGRRQPKP